MRRTNDSYVIRKVSARGRTFRMTAEQVLNHLLPALAGLPRGRTIRVEHREAG